LTQLRVAWTAGDEKAFETHKLSSAIIDWKNVEWKSRAHFLAVASQMMLRIFVDHARARRNLKRGGEWKQMSLSEVEFLPENRRTDVLDIDEDSGVIRWRKTEYLKGFSGLSSRCEAKWLNRERPFRFE